MESFGNALVTLAKSVRIDKDVYCLLTYHLRKVTEIGLKSQSQALSEAEKNELNVSRLFVETVMLYPVKQNVTLTTFDFNTARVFAENLENNSAYLKCYELNNEIKSLVFKSNFKVGDILLLKTKEVTDCYRFCVKGSEINHDVRVLNIPVIVPKSEASIELQKNDYVTAFITNFTSDPFYISVKLDKKTSKKEIRKKLAEEGIKEKSTCSKIKIKHRVFSENLRASPNFNLINASSWESSLSKIGLNPHEVYSYDLCKPVESKESKIIPEKFVNEAKEINYQKSVERARRCIKSKDFENAVKLYDSALKMKPNSVEILVERAKLQEMRTNYSEAVVDWWKAMTLSTSQHQSRRDPRNKTADYCAQKIAEMLYNSAKKYEKGKEYKKAFECCQRAEDLVKDGKSKCPLTVSREK